MADMQEYFGEEETRRASELDDTMKESASSLRSAIAQLIAVASLIVGLLPLLLSRDLLKQDDVATKTLLLTAAVLLVLSITAGIVQLVTNWQHSRRHIAAQANISQLARRLSHLDKQPDEGATAERKKMLTHAYDVSVDIYVGSLPKEPTTIAFVAQMTTFILGIAVSVLVLGLVVLSRP